MCVVLWGNLPLTPSLSPGGGKEDSGRPAVGERGGVMKPRHRLGETPPQLGFTGGLGGGLI